MKRGNLIIDKVSDIVPLKPDFEQDKVLTEEDLEEEEEEE